MCHLPAHLERDGYLLDAFTLERKHQQVKRAASNTDNTRDFEVSVLARLHLEELRAQADIQFAAGLRGPRVRHEPLAAVVADGLESKGLSIYSGDIVFRRGSALLVAGAIMFDQGELALLVRPLQFSTRLSPVATTWRKLSHMARCGCEGLRFAACWSIEGGEFTVLEL